MADRFRLRDMRRNDRLGDVPRENSVPPLPTSAVSLGGDDLPRHTSALEDLVPRHVADLRFEERDERTEPAASSRTSELQHGVAVPSQVAPRDGSPGTGAAFRHG